MAEATQLRVGALLPTSRMFPGLDQDYLAGLRAGLAEGGLEPALTVEPAGNAAVQSAFTEKIQRLLLGHRPHVVTGIVGSAMLRHVHMFFSQARTPFIVNSLGADPVLDGGARNPWIFHNSFNLWQSTYALGYWAARSLGSRACIAAGFHEAGYGLVPAFWKGFGDAGGGTILATEVTHRGSADEDPTEQLRRLTAHEPDFVLALYSGREGISFARAYAALGLHGAVPLVSSAFMTHRRWLPAMGDGALGVRTAFSWNRARGDDADRRFRDACAAGGWDDPDVFGLLGYETGRALCRAVEAAPPADRGTEALRDAIAAVSFESPRGPWHLDPDSGEVATSDWLLEVRRGADGGVHLEVADSLPLPPAFRPDYDAYRSQELRAGWINPYLVN